MIRNKIIIFFLLITAQTFAQRVFNPESYKIPSIKFTDYRTEKDFFGKLSVVVNPVRQKYPVSNFITDIFNSGDTVWFATGSGIMKTIDKYKSFDSYFGIEPFGTDDVAGFCLNKNVVAVATAISQEISGDNIPVGTGIKISTDYGLTWNSFPQPVDNQADSIIMYGTHRIYALPVVVRQQNLSYDIAITRTKIDSIHYSNTDYTIWITSFAGGLRKSTDYGATWQRVVLPPDNLDSIYISDTTTYNFQLNPRNSSEGGNYNHRVFTVESANDSSVIYVGTADGINSSSDGGESWRKYSFENTGSGTNRIAGNFVVNLHVQKYSGKEIIWGATKITDKQGEVNAVSYSSNGGLNWAYTLKDNPPNNISSKDSLVFAETQEGLWRAYFGIFDWNKPSLIYDEETKDKLRTNFFYSGNNIKDTLYFGTSDGLLRIVESGQPWTGKWKIYRALQEIDIASDLKTYAAPNPFSPDDEVTRFYYKSGKSQSKITIKIFDFGMNPVRTLIQNAVRANPDELYTSWDGKSNEGYRVANGVYFYRVEIDEDKPVWGKIIVLQ